MAQYMGVVSALCNSKEAVPFLRPIDPVADKCHEPHGPNYFDLILQPMCLYDVRRKVQAGMYATAKEFSRDMQLILTNCGLYHNRMTDRGRQTLKKQEQLAVKLREEILKLKKELEAEESERARQSALEKDQQAAKEAAIKAKALEAQAKAAREAFEARNKATRTFVREGETVKEQWLVDRIVAERQHPETGMKEFKCKWQNIPAAEATWESFANLMQCTEVIKTWQHRQHKIRAERERRQRPRRVEGLGITERFVGHESMRPYSLKTQDTVYHPLDEDPERVRQLVEAKKATIPSLSQPPGFVKLKQDAEATSDKPVKRSDGGSSNPQKTEWKKVEAGQSTGMLARPQYQDLGIDRQLKWTSAKQKKGPPKIQLGDLKQKDNQLPRDKPDQDKPPI